MSEELNKNLGVDINPETGGIIGGEKLEQQQETVEDKEFELTPEIEAKMVAEAEKHITDIINYGKPLPVRFASSALFKKTFTDGLINSSFLVDQGSHGYKIDQIYYTRNENFTTATRKDRKDLLRGHHSAIVLDQHNPKEAKEAIYPKYPEVLEAMRSRHELYEWYVQETEKLGMSKYDRFSHISTGELNEKAEDLLKKLDSNTAKKLTRTINLFERTLPLVDPEKIYELIEKYSPDGYDKTLVSNIINEFITGHPFNDWSFEEKELWYETVLKIVMKNRGSLNIPTQVYDIAYLLDPNTKTQQEKAYLGDEIAVTAKADSILGLVFIDFEKNIDNKYIIEKMKRVYAKNPILSRPIYGNDGNLLWPREMSYDEVKKFVAERDAEKSKEQETEKQEGEQ